MILKNITVQLLEKLINEIKQPDNMSKIKINIVDPLIGYTYNKLYPYIYAMIILFLLTFILAILIFMLLLKISLKLC